MSSRAASVRARPKSRARISRVDGERAAEEERVGLGGVERDAGAGEGLEQQAERDRLAVDEHAVAVEDDEGGRGRSLAGEVAAERRLGAVGPEGAEPAGEGVAEGAARRRWRRRCRAWRARRRGRRGRPRPGRCRRSQFGSLGSMAGAAVGACRRSSGPRARMSSARPSTGRPRARRSAIEGMMNFGWRLEPSRQSRRMVSPILGLSQRRTMSAK